MRYADRGHTCDYPRLNVFILFLHRQPDDPGQAAICLMTASAIGNIASVSPIPVLLILHAARQTMLFPRRTVRNCMVPRPGAQNKNLSFLTAITLMLFRTLRKPLP